MMIQLRVIELIYFKNSHKYIEFVKCSFLDVKSMNNVVSLVLQFNIDYT